jgi:UDP-GlcNAc3NAcA epimerase
MKIVTIIGARPQFIKAGVVSNVLSKKPAIKEAIIHTGQHFDAGMSDIFFDQLNIPRPKHLLDIHGGGHADMTARMLVAIEKILPQEKPDYVMVYGDTNSTLAGALAASKLHIPVIHVEAGLRSFNRKMPEEINRILTDHMSSILFCPTDQAVKNLQHEGFQNRNDTTIIKNGDVMQDSVRLLRGKSKRPEALSSLKGDFALCTFHRAENTDDLHNLSQIVSALNHIHQNIVPVVLPLHPRTKQSLEKAGIQLSVHVIEPVGYLEMLWLLDQCKLVLTDSGGLQKEAFFLLKPCVTMRDQTEWIELVDAGVNILTGAEAGKIIPAAEISLGKRVVDDKDYYGGGQASVRIADYLASLI